MKLTPSQRVYCLGAILFVSLFVCSLNFGRTGSPSFLVPLAVAGIAYLFAIREFLSSSRLPQQVVIVGLVPGDPLAGGEQLRAVLPQEGFGRIDKTLLLLLGQEREPVSVVLDRNNVSIAACHATERWNSCAVTRETMNAAKVPHREMNAFATRLKRPKT